MPQVAHTVEGGGDDADGHGDEVKQGNGGHEADSATVGKAVAALLSQAATLFAEGDAVVR